MRLRPRASGRRGPRRADRSCGRPRAGGGPSASASPASSHAPSRPFARAPRVARKRCGDVRGGTSSSSSRGVLGAEAPVLDARRRTRRTSAGGGETTAASTGTYECALPPGRLRRPSRGRGGSRPSGLSGREVPAPRLDHREVLQVVERQEHGAVAAGREPDERPALPRRGSSGSERRRSSAALFEIAVSQFRPGPQSRYSGSLSPSRAPLRRDFDQRPGHRRLERPRGRSRCPGRRRATTGSPCRK